MTEVPKDSIRLHLTSEQQREIQRVTGQYLTILELSLEEFDRRATPPKGRPLAGPVDDG